MNKIIDLLNNEKYNLLYICNYIAFNYNIFKKDDLSNYITALTLVINSDDKKHLIKEYLKLIEAEEKTIL